MGNELYVGSGRTYEVRVMSLTGRLQRIIRVAEPPRRVTDDEWRELVERSAPSNVTAAQRTRIMTAVQARRGDRRPTRRTVAYGSTQRDGYGSATITSANSGRCSTRPDP